MSIWKESAENVWVAAHRGFSEKYPENTMEAFRAAAELGVDQIETDIRATKDGVLVLMHDDAADRTTDGSGKIADMTYEDVRRLDAGVKKGPQFAGCRVPAFIELLDLALKYPALTLDLELKEYPVPGNEDRAYDVCRRVVTLVEEYGMADRIVLNTFSGKLHEFIRAEYGTRYPRHVYFPESFLGEVTSDPYADAACCCMCTEDPEEWKKMAERGVEPWAGASCRDEETVQRAIDRGAALITCNNPDDVLRILREKGRHA